MRVALATMFVDIVICRIAWFRFCSPLLLVCISPRLHIADLDSRKEHEAIFATSQGSVQSCGMLHAWR